MKSLARWDVCAGLAGVCLALWILLPYSHATSMLGCMTFCWMGRALGRTMTVCRVHQPPR